MDEMQKQRMAYRYQKIEEALVKQVEDWAEDYKLKEGNNRIEDNHGEITQYTISDEKLDKEATENAIEDILETVEDKFNNDIYYIFELIMEEKFGWSVCESNPYKIKPPKYKCEMSVMGIPVIKLEEDKKWK